MGTTSELGRAVAILALLLLATVVRSWIARDVGIETKAKATESRTNR